MKVKNIVIFVSGNGSNMESIINHFKNNTAINVVGVFSNKPECLALVKAKKHKVDTFVFSKKELTKDVVLKKLKELSPSLIVLAGFLLKIPESIVKEFPSKIINVHPALLPKFGGKGMYGKQVHEAVIEAKEKKSGITIHYVNEKYDEGNIIAQFACALSKNETVEMLQQKIHELEQVNFSKTIEKVVLR